MNNLQLADVFERIANLLDIKGEIIYKSIAYRRTAEVLRSLPEDINILHQQGRLTDIPGVGKAISGKIAELLTTGTLDFLADLEKEVPASLLTLLEVTDVGPKRAALFWKQANILTLADLETAARAGRLRQIPGMGEKTEARILAGIEALARRSKRMTLGTAWEIARRWLDWLRQHPDVQRAEPAGSLRRWRSTIGDLDLVASSNKPTAVMEGFIHHPEVVRILGQGGNKSSIELSNGLNIQLWLQPPERFGTLWQYASGSKDHNVRLRELAQRKGLSLSEQSILDAEGKENLCSSEEEVYAMLGLPWIPPEMREDRGEVQAAVTGSLPQLLNLDQVRNDLHMHSTWSDGTATIRSMAEAARQRGLTLIAITDHSSGMGIVNGLTLERIRQQRQEIDAVQREMGTSMRILQGSEVEIHADGRLEFSDAVLAELDIVVASLHTSLRQEKQVITQRLLNVLRNPHVDIIGHPSGRLLPNREGADLDWEVILPAARESGIALEINANPYRLDLDEVYVRRAAEMGIPLSINTDSHSVPELGMMENGVSVARRAWAPPGDILNTWDNQRLAAWLNQRS
jgi:DNA polymerase (family 10)